MSDPQSVPWWQSPAWIGGIVSALGALYAVAARIFSYVTRDELAQILADQRKEFARDMERQRQTFRDALTRLAQDSAKKLESQVAVQRDMHRENRDLFSELFSKVNETKEGLARLNGELSGLLRNIDDR